jgi:hypothetical protein
MKRFLVKGFCSGILVLAFKGASAQKPVLSVFGGAQLTTAKYKVDEIKQPTDFVTGFQLGATIKIPFENNLYFAPAMYYSKKGYKVILNQPSFPPTELAINNETSLHTLEISPMLQYDFSKDPGHFFMKLGPAIDIAFAGKESFDTKEGKHIDRDMKFSFADYGRFTAQAVLHFGYQASNGLSLFAHYAEGLGGLNNADGGPVIKHRIVGLSLGWVLHKNPNVLDTRVKE